MRKLINQKDQKIQSKLKKIFKGNFLSNLNKKIKFIKNYCRTNKTVKIYKEKINDEKKLEQEFDKMFSNKPINKKPDPKNFLKRKTSKTPIHQVL